MLCKNTGHLVHLLSASLLIVPPPHCSAPQLPFRVTMAMQGIASSCVAMQALYHAGMMLHACLPAYLHAGSVRAVATSSTSTFVDAKSAVASAVAAAVASACGGSASAAAQALSTAVANATAKAFAQSTATVTVEGEHQRALLSTSAVLPARRSTCNCAYA